MGLGKKPELRLIKSFLTEGAVWAHQGQQLLSGIFPATTTQPCSLPWPFTSQVSVTGVKFSPGNTEVSREICARKNVKVKGTSMECWKPWADMASEGPVLEPAQRTHFSGFQLHKG